MKSFFRFPCHASLGMKIKNRRVVFRAATGENDFSDEQCIYTLSGSAKSKDANRLIERQATKCIYTLNEQRRRENLRLSKCAGAKASDQMPIRGGCGSINRKHLEGALD